MDSTLLLGQLRAGEAAECRRAALVFGLVEEVHALPDLRTRYLAAETPAEIKPALHWAGTRLHAAQARAYDTFDEIYREFRLEPARREAEEHPMIRAMQAGLEAEQMRADFNSEARVREAYKKTLSVTGSVVGVVGTGLLNNLIDRVAPPPSGQTGPLMPSRLIPNERRIPPLQPSDFKVPVWLNRLRQSTDSAQREQALREILEWNNPSTLADLAEVYHTEALPSLKAAIEATAKKLYWRMIYWEMSQAGALERAIWRKASTITEADTLRWDIWAGGEA